jgi:hypothetical protein
MHAGVDGLLRDKTRPWRKPPLDRALVVELTASDAPGEATHSTRRRWPSQPVSASARFSVSGAPMACSRIGCASFSCRKTRSLPPS